MKDANAKLAAMGSNVNVAGIMSILGLVAAASLVGMYYATKCINGKAWDFTNLSSGAGENTGEGTEATTNGSNAKTDDSKPSKDNKTESTTTATSETEAPAEDSAAGETSTSEEPTATE